jgi:hypothetical protein
MALSDVQPWNLPSYAFPHEIVEHDSATLDLSGSCALVRDAPFHSTPEGWIAASAYAFAIHTGFTVFGQLAALTYRVSRPPWIHWRYGSPLRGAEASTS